MRRALIALLVAGCAAGPDFGQIQRDCSGDWPCMRAAMAKTSRSPDVTALYIAKGDFVAEQVRDGKMTDAEARLAMADAHHKAVAAVQTRRAERIAAWGAINASMPATCVRSGNIINCY